MLKRRLLIASFLLLFAAAILLPPLVSEWSWRPVFIREARITVAGFLEKVSRMITILRDLHRVGERNLVLEEENARLRLQVILTEGISRENEELANLLKIKDKYSSYTIVPARFLGYSPTNPNRIAVYFDESETRNLAQNAPVVSSLGLVGLVRKFGKTYADVELITSRGFTLPAVIEGRDECTAILRGNGQTLSIQFLEKVCNNPPALGKRLLSANLSENYSLPYVPIALIGRLSDDPTNMLFYAGEAVPLFKKGKLHHLFIITGGALGNENLRP